MNWTELIAEEQLEDIRIQSAAKPIVIFKHSTRCSISSMAMNRLEKIPENGAYTFYYLDLIRYRPLSDKVAAQYQVHHQSPQALLIINGECVYEESHNGITAQDIEHEIMEWRAKMPK